MKRVLETSSRSTLVLALGCASLIGCARPLPPDYLADTVAATRYREQINEAAKPAETETAAAAEPTGFATLQGVVKLAGTPPTYPAPKVTSDPGVCGGDHVKPLRVLVDGDGGLANVLIYVNSTVPNDPKWIHESYGDAKGEVEFDQKKCVFLSRVSLIRSTQSLKILNSDPVGHNTNIVGKKIKPFNQIVAAGSYAMYQPAGVTPSPADVSCTIHPWMSAYLFTRDHPYMAVTKADGSFEMPNVPAGVPLEFKIWHEATGYVGSIKLDGTALKTPKGTLVKTLEPDTPAKWDLTLDATLMK